MSTETGIREKLIESGLLKPSQGVAVSVLRLEPGTPVLFDDEGAENPGFAEYLLEAEQLRRRAAS